MKKKKWLLWWLAGLIVSMFLLVFLVKSDITAEIDRAVLTPTPTMVVERKIESKIGIVADIHNDLESLKLAIEQMKKEEVKLLLVAGDLTNNGTEEELVKVKKVLDESKMDYMVVPGNHDLYKEGVFKAVFGDEWQTRMVENEKIVLINNGNWRGLGTDQKKWIEKETKECLRLRCVVVMHEPLGHYLTTHVMGEYKKETVAESIWLNDLLLANGVKQIWVGHLHFNSTYTYFGMETTIVGAISKTRNNQTPRWEEVVIYDDGSLEGKEMIL